MMWYDVTIFDIQYCIVSTSGGIIILHYTCDAVILAQGVGFPGLAAAVKSVLDTHLDR